MQLFPGEPPAAPWRSEPVQVLVDLLLAAAGPVQGRPRVVAVDGRGGGGKTTLARQLRDAVDASAVVHTDDVAWHTSFFGWADLLAEGVLAPLHRGEAVRYRPPGWVTKDRPGAIEVPAGLDLVVVEGVGAGRRELAHLVDVVVWVQSDRGEAMRLGLARDVAQGAEGGLEGATAFWHEWEAEEAPFQLDSRPWERAAVVVAGTSRRPHDPSRVVLAPGPLSPTGQPAPPPA